MKIRPLAALFAAPLLALSTLSAHAQANSFDVAAGGGVADYFGSGSANSTKGLFEATAMYNFAPHIGVGFEYTFSPISSETQTFGNVTQSITDHIQHFGGVIHVPLVTKAHVEPYLVARGGGLHETANGTQTGNGSTLTASATANGGYVGTGVGANLFAAGGFGIRPELRYEFLKENGGHLHEMDFTVSVFYRFGGRRK